MDLSLNDYIKRSSEITDRLLLSDNVYQVANLIREHNTMLKYVERCYNKLLNDFKNIIQHSKENKICSKIIDVKDVDYIKKTCKKIYINNKQDLNKIPNDICWLPNLNQYGININGVILRGNLMNIKTKSPYAHLIFNYGNHLKLLI